MSERGQSRTFLNVRAVSAFPPNATDAEAICEAVRPTGLSRNKGNASKALWRIEFVIFGQEFAILPYETFFGRFLSVGSASAEKNWARCGVWSLGPSFLASDVRWVVDPMIESIMYLGIGFLLGALIGLAVIPLVHSRAVRLTVRRLEAAMPLSAAELQADKDLLRAEFAISTRRLEMTIEQLRNKTTCQLVELGKKEDAIKRIKIEREALEAELIVLRTLVRGARGVAHRPPQLPKAVPLVPKSA